LWRESMTGSPSPNALTNFSVDQQPR
jgi:hypothetical protein